MCDLTTRVQSEEIQSTLKQNMKILRHNGDGKEFQIEMAVNNDMVLIDLKKQLSSTTGISLEKLHLVVRGNALNDCHPNTKITDFWSPEDIVAILSKESPAEDEMPQEVHQIAMESLSDEAG